MKITKLTLDWQLYEQQQQQQKYDHNQSQNQIYNPNLIPNPY